MIQFSDLESWANPNNFFGLLIYDLQQGRRYKNRPVKVCSKFSTSLNCNRKHVDFSRKRARKTSQVGRVLSLKCTTSVCRSISECNPMDSDVPPTVPVCIGHSQKTAPEGYCRAAETMLYLQTCTVGQVRIWRVSTTPRSNWGHFTCAQSEESRI